MELTEAAAALAAVPAKYATPDPATLAKLPKPTKRDNPPGKCDVCGGWHGLPAIHIDYQGHADITLSLIEIDPLWSWRPASLADDGSPLVLVRGKRLVLWGYLTVHGVERMCVGTCDDSKGDPEKELIGDLLRNGSMRFGIATRLWSKAEGADPAGSEHAGGYGPQTAPRAPRGAKEPDKATEAQMRKMHATFNELGITDRDERLQFCAAHAREVASSKELTKAEAGTVIDALERILESQRGGR